MTISLVQPYNPSWPEWFESIRMGLDQALGKPSCPIEHVGGTSVPGMAAKPIIDLDIIVAQQAFSSVKERLAAIGYVHQGDLGVPQREAFDLVQEGRKQTLPPHHLYVCIAGAAALDDHLAFRDFLRKSPDWVRRLSNHKIHLCELYNNDRRSYIDGKATLVREITELARTAVRRGALSTSGV